MTQSGWHSEPCTAAAPAGMRGYDNYGQGQYLAFRCQKPQKWQGSRDAGHGIHYKHTWAGVVGGCQVQISWYDPP